MSATDRVVVLMSPEEKAALEAKVARAGRISTGEFVRRAIEAYDADTLREAAELKALLATLAATHRRTLGELDRVEKKLDVTLAGLGRLKRRA